MWSQKKAYENHEMLARTFLSQQVFKPSSEVFYYLQIKAVLLNQTKVSGFYPRDNEDSLMDSKKYTELHHHTCMLEKSFCYKTQTMKQDWKQVDHAQCH